MTPMLGKGTARRRVRWAICRAACTHRRASRRLRRVGLRGRAVLLLANLVATSFLIRLLGPASYGLWTLLLVATAWASTADLGMGTASTKFGCGLLRAR